MSNTLTISEPQGPAMLATAGFLFDALPLAERAREAALLLKLCRTERGVLMAAQQHERTVGACFAQIAGGGQAFLRPPKLADDAPTTCWPQLWETLRERLAAKGLTYAQASVDPNSDLTLWTALGFQQVAELVFLVAETPASLTPPTGLELDAYDPDDADRMQRVIETTYLESTDCPNAEGMRTTQDTVQGYRETGVFAPQNWFYVQESKQDIGCLLLTDHPELNQFELIYMGLDVAHRGRGLGKKLAQFAQWRCRQANRERILVAVDRGNHAAMATYTSCGFHPLLEQVVLAQTLP